jgi:hypothetical protein
MGSHALLSEHLDCSDNYVPEDISTILFCCYEALSPQVKYLYSSHNPNLLHNPKKDPQEY